MKLKEKFKLFDHQAEAVEFLLDKKRAILADSMGLGKTKTAIVAASKASQGVILVICPASLKLNWMREIQMVDDQYIFVVQGGHEETPTSAEDARWIIVNYDVLGRNPWLDELDIDAVILDEAHYIKGKSVRSEHALKFVKDKPIVYLLTGTPLLNRPVEMFNLLKAIKHPLGKLRTVFVRRYCGGQLKAMVQDLTTGSRFFVTPDRSYGFKPPRYRKFIFMDENGATRLDELREFTADSFLRRTKAEVLDLPGKIISTLDVTLGDEDRQAYEDAWDRYLSWVEQHPDMDRNIDNIKSAQQLIELGKLKQVCSKAKVSRITADVLNAVEQGNKVIIFSQYTETIARLEALITKGKAKCVTLTGQHRPEERQDAVDQFQNGDVQVFIANIKAGGVGITLTAASIVIFADMDWSPKINEQAMDRAHRIGQTGTVNVYYYVCEDTVEGEIVKLLQEKSEVIGQIMKE